MGRAAWAFPSSMPSRRSPAAPVGGSNSSMTIYGPITRSSSGSSRGREKTSSGAPLGRIVAQCPRSEINRDPFSRRDLVPFDCRRTEIHPRLTVDALDRNAVLTAELKRSSSWDWSSFSAWPVSRARLPAFGDRLAISRSLTLNVMAFQPLDFAGAIDGTPKNIHSVLRTRGAFTLRLTDRDR
jgi:hypothetical protein